MKTLFSILMIAFLISYSCTKVNRTPISFELRFAKTEPDINYKEMTLYNSDLKFFVHDSVFITNNDIMSAEVIEWQKRPNVKVVLNEEGRKKFADFTLNNISKNAAMIVDNKLVSAPRINAQITKGILIIAGFFNQEDAQKIAEGIIPKK